MAENGSQHPAFFLGVDLPALTSLVVQLVWVACWPFPYDQKLESLFRAEKAAALGRQLR